MRPSFRRLFCLSLLLFLFAACTQAEGELSTPTETSSALVSTVTLPATSAQPIIPTRKPTLTASPTRTPMPTLTPGPTMTPFPTRTATHEMTATPWPTPTPWPTLTPILESNFTPTLDVSSFVTRTPAPAAQCPVENPELIPNFEPPTFTSEAVYKFFDDGLDFLNSGGTRQAFIAWYQSHYKHADRLIQEIDVTGDGVPDLLVTESNSLMAYLCEGGQYRLTGLVGETYHFNQPAIVNVQDMNLDGVAEVIAIAGDLRIRIVSVIEWDGNKFQTLNPDLSLYFPHVCSDLLGESWAYAIDTDHNGTLELVLKQGIPIWTEYSDGLPWRKETRTCAWNGTMFVHTHTEYAPPEYRFQAVQDGDRAMSAGEYDIALDLYQQTIFNVELDWWTEERWHYEFQAHINDSLYKPTPLPSLLPDPAEYFYLAAYARFRIMLIHLLRGYLSDAEIVYNTLQEKFPAGQPGAEFAEMAALFWNEYKISSDMGLSCAAAIQYISNYPDILTTYLGDYYHGAQSPTYNPPDVCPFTSSP